MATPESSWTGTRAPTLLIRCGACLRLVLVVIAVSLACGLLLLRLGPSPVGTALLAPLAGLSEETAEDDVAEPMSRTLGPGWRKARKRRRSLSLELITRAHAGADSVLRGKLLRSLVAFWPPERFGSVVVVLDDTPEDRACGAALLTDFSRLVGVEYANRTRLRINEGGLFQHGYHVQQFDTLHLDWYSSAAFVGIVDTDTLLLTPPHELDFFDDAGRPHVIPRVEAPWGDLWIGAANASPWFIGEAQPFRCMSYFPLVFKREHLAALRAHVEKLHGAPFGRVFYRYVFKIKGGTWLYSQFNVMCT